MKYLVERRIDVTVFDEIQFPFLSSRVTVVAEEGEGQE